MSSGCLAVQEAHTPRNTDARILQMMIFHATVRNLGRCLPVHRCNKLVSCCLAQLLVYLQEQCCCQCDCQVCWTRQMHHRGCHHKDTSRRVQQSSGTSHCVCFSWFVNWHQLLQHECGVPCVLRAVFPASYTLVPEGLHRNVMHQTTLYMQVYLLWKSLSALIKYAVNVTSSRK